jgi:acyl carrier protein
VGLGDALRSAPPDERLGLLGSRLQEHVGQVLGLPPSRIDLREPLNGLGFDSLMSIELRNRIQADLGFELPLGRLMEWPTVGELAASLARQFEAGEAEDRAQPEPETTQEVAAERAEDLPTSLDGLSDEQVSAMLGRALAQREGRQ